MTIELKKYSSALREVWDSLINESKTPNFLFVRDYLDYHADRFDDASLLIYKDGKAVAAFPCNQADDAIVSHGGLTYGGLIVRLELHAPDILEVMSEICAHFRKLGFARIVYKAVPSIFNSYPSEEALYAVTRLGGTLYRRDLSSVIDLHNVPKLSDSRKNTARKAGKVGAVVQRSEDFVGFHGLLESVLEKFGTRPVHSSAELLLLRSRFPQNILLFGTFLEGEMLAGALVYDFGDVVHTQYLAASDSGRKLGALDFLLMNLIEGTFAQRRYFSFGISTEQNGTVLNEGLIRQKEGFGGRGVVHDFYEIKL